VLDLQGPRTLVAFWDVDAPATLDRVHGDAADPLPRAGAALRPGADLRRRRAGAQAYLGLGARDCVPIYNALDPSTHFPVAPEPRFAGDLGFLGNRLPDREARVEEFFLRAAAQLPDRKFLLGGSGWGDKPMPANVTTWGHVYTADHNAFNCTPRAVLNVSRESMARYGFSPATRVFEAAGAAACLITDAWEGLETFFEPGARCWWPQRRRGGGSTCALDADKARAVGQAAYRRVLAEHTYDHRAARSSMRCSKGQRAESCGGRMTHDPPLSIVILGLSITSSWGNGHATTYRGLVRELVAAGHDVLFLERDQPWYAAHRDLPTRPGAAPSCTAAWRNCTTASRRRCARPTW
jgi:spore maturation protein CgeB